jgi:hypothetical protein
MRRTSKVSTKNLKEKIFLKMRILLPQFLLKLLSKQPIPAQTDCHWLRIVYKKLGGNVKLIPRNCCRMMGVECTDDHVTGIHWEFRQLAGTIPAELENLVYLERL